VAIRIVPKAQPHFKAYRSPDLAAAIGYLTSIRIPDQDAGKDTAGFLDSDTLAFETALLLSRCGDFSAPLNHWEFYH